MLEVEPPMAVAVELQLEDATVERGRAGAVVQQVDQLVLIFEGPPPRCAPPELVDEVVDEEHTVFAPVGPVGEHAVVAGVEHVGATPSEHGGVARAAG